MIQVPDHKEKKLFEGSDKSNSTDNEQHGHERIDENETDEMVRTWFLIRSDTSWAAMAAPKA